VLAPETLVLYERCRELYDDAVLACFMAPAFPDQSRNNLWVCKKA